MNKLERLLKLLAALLDTTQPLTADDLRQKIGGYPDMDASFNRAFERDKADLREMGVTILVTPVTTTEPPIDGYRVDPLEYAGRDPGLEADELAALHLAAALVHVDTLGSDALWKLGGTEADSSGPAVQLDPGGETELAGIFQEAIANRQVATFTYTSVDRELEPARLSFTQGHWYVSGFDRSRSADRVFRLDRVERPVDLGSPNAFDARSARGPQVTRTWELGDEEPIDATVQIEPAMVSTARLQLTNGEIEEQADGAIIATVSIRNTDRFRDWVLSFYDNAVVLGPPELREAMLGWFAAISSGEPGTTGTGGG